MIYICHTYIVYIYIIHTYMHTYDHLCEKVHTKFIKYALGIKKICWKACNKSGGWQISTRT